MTEGLLPVPDTHHKLSTDDFAELIACREIWPGDAVIYDHPGFSPVWSSIESVQHRLLKDLIVPKGAKYTQSLKDLVHYHASFTHANIVWSSVRAIGQSSPAMQYEPWDTFRGCRIRVLRPAGADEDDLRQAAIEALEDLSRGIKYPHSEILLYYGWSWQIQKLWLGRKFLKVFDRKHTRVCSASVVDWWLRAGVEAFTGDRPEDAEWPESWYPGRLSAGCGKLECVFSGKLI